MVRSQRARIDAEAASWLSRLHSSDKSARTEGAFRAWLSASDMHRQAFERATELWDMLPNVAGDHVPRLPAREPSRHRFAWAACVALVLGIVSLWWATRPPLYETRIGEQRVVVLSDDTRVALNTNSELEIDYSKAQRRVVLDHGEALFEVSKDASRPFLVFSGDQVVRAVGTKFVVRHDHGQTRVTLLEGRVEVLGPQATPRAPLAVLMPGQRLTVTANAGAALDMPPLDAVTAWRRGEIVFDNMTLIGAAEELNRYSDTHLIIADPRLASLRVSGIFSTKDVPEVAKAFAALYHLKVEQDGTDYKLVEG